MRTLSITTFALLASGCLSGTQPHTSFEAHSGVMTPPSYVIYQDSAGPLSYHSVVAKGIVHPARRVQGKACQTGLQVPLFGLHGGGTWLSAAIDDGTYAEALEAAHAQAPDSLLYDVRADLQARTILLVYRQECLIVNAAVASPSAATN